MGACTLVYDWYYYVAVGIITFIGGLIILIPCRLLWYIYYNEPSRVNRNRGQTSAMRSSFSRIRASAVTLLSGNNTISKCLVVFVFLLNMMGIILYLIDVSLYSRDDCGTVRDDPVQLTYLTLCVVYTIHYILRFIAGSDKMSMWLDIYSIVDHFTIGPAFFCLYKDVNWIGLRFLRILYLLQLPEVLQLTHVLKASSKIRLAQVASIFLSIWFCASGFVQVIENNGDPHHDYSNGQELGYWESVYWLLVTMSTVGYGEICPKTNICRAFIVLFIMGSFAMFSTLIPELANHLGHSTKYKKPYKRIYGKKHIVVCGHISYDAVSNFIKNFIHEDAENADTDVVFVDNHKPDLELEAFFKRHFNNVTFVQGSVMDINSLKNVKLMHADACLILADRNCANPDDEDAANIMRAASVKNFHPEIRVIIQVLQYHNKTNLLNFPNWNWDKVNGDDVICVSQLKLGLMAQNCLAPGISTLVSNLLTMRSFKQQKKKANWQDIYRFGAANEIYIQLFSTDFQGMSFKKAAEICFNELHILLIGIETSGLQVQTKLRLNPQNVVICPNTAGIFIAQSPEEARRVSYYKAPEDDEAMAIRVEMSSNGCAPSAPKAIPMGNTGKAGLPQSSSEEFMDYMDGVGSRMSSHRNRRPSMDALALLKQNQQINATTGQQEMFDFTGLFHWCPSRDMKQATLNYDTIGDYDLENHVVICLLADESSPRIGLSNFIMPLRTSNFRLNELKDILILGDPSYIEKEWSSMCNFPQVFIFPGCAAQRSDLRALNLVKCDMCAILTAKRHIIVDQRMLDMEAILTCLNVKGMFGNSMEDRLKRIGIISSEEEVTNNNFNENTEIPMTTELEIESNVQFLDQDDDDNPDTPLYMTQPFASGRAFASSVLDSLMGATYQNSQILTVIRALITGAEIGEFEQILAEGLGIVRKISQKDQTLARERCRIDLLPLNTGLLAGLDVQSEYSSLFNKALEAHSILCLGLYRLMQTDPRCGKRYVITNPPCSFPVYRTDKVYCLRPCSTNGDARTTDGLPPSYSEVAPTKPTQKPYKRPQFSKIDSVEDDTDYTASGAETTRF